MSKFRVSFKIEKLELEVEGTRDDMPLIANQVGRQVASLFQPAAALVTGESAGVDIREAEAVVLQPATTDGKRKTTRRKKSSPAMVPGAAEGGKSTPDAAIIWRHDTAKWGSPKKDWSLSNKILYLLFVAREEASQRDLTATAIVDTFNRLFKQAGPLETRYVTRELGRMKGRNLAPVSEDATVTPSLWFLNSNGDKEFRQLVSEGNGHEASSPTLQADAFAEGESE